jgi:chemotaxis protein methyltransferase WspC
MIQYVKVEHLLPDDLRERCSWRSRRELTDVENLLATRLGFDIHTVGPEAVEAVVRRSMEEAGFSDPAAYARMLAVDPDAWNRLRRSGGDSRNVVFQGHRAVRVGCHLAALICARASDKVLRILSCPCSTGEEPYSLVMAMLHAGAPPESFTVDAVDVSRRALESAQAAVSASDRSAIERPWYRGRPTSITPKATGLWRLKDSVVSQVRFRQGISSRPAF